MVEEQALAAELQDIAEAVRLRTDVTFVVITDVEGIRYSHPNVERIGHPVSTDPGPALAGVSDWYVQTGTLGPSVRGKVPIWSSTGEVVVGMVSVGVLTGEVSETLNDRLAGLLLAGGGALAGEVPTAASISWRNTLRRTRRKGPRGIISRVARLVLRVFTGVGCCRDVIGRGAVRRTIITAAACGSEQRERGKKREQSQ